MDIFIVWYIFQIEVETATYNSTAVALLERLRHKLSKDMDQAKSEVDRIRKDLAKYQTVSVVKIFNVGFIVLLLKTTL